MHSRVAEQSPVPSGDRVGTAWARDPEHRSAKKRGREEWYRHYLIRICKVEREYGRPDA